MVCDGAVLIGPRPLGSPSLADNTGEVKAILDTLWPGGQVAAVGKGRVFAAGDAAGPLQAIKLGPDFTYTKPGPDSHVMFIHRRLSDGDAYFLSNRIDRADTVEASFRVAGRKPELWDPSTGLMAPASYRIEAGRTLVSVPLERFGSVFVMFREPAGSQSSRRIPENALETVRELAGPWQVAFQTYRGAPASATFDRLVDFRDHADPGIRYFSGIATYSKEVQLPSSQERSAHLRLDLGQVRDLAEVWVNGKLMGTAWKPPYRVDIAGAVVAGSNRIEVKSVNLWVNRLIGDVQGDTRKYTFTWVDGKPLPAGVGRGRAAAMPYCADSPLRASGLIGPVKIIHEVAAN